MKLSMKEYDAMQSGWRKWINKNIEIKGFKTWGLDFTGKDILEVGCGSGYSASQICMENPSSYTGIDLKAQGISEIHYEGDQDRFLPRAVIRPYCINGTGILWGRK